MPIAGSTGSVDLLVEAGQDFLQFVGIVGGEDAPDRALEVGQAGFQDDLFDFGQMGGMHGEFAQAEAEEQTGQSGVAGHFAAYGDGFTGFPGRAQGVGNEHQDGGMERVEEVGHGVVGAVDGQGILNQVIGANGQEVQFVQEQGRASAAAGTSIIPPMGR